MLRRTFKDFCDAAYREYGDELRHIDALMRRLGITEQQVVCYINWTEGMTHKNIADELGVTRQTVTRHIAKMRDSLPHLFDFVQHNTFQYRSRKHDRSAIHTF